MLYENNIDSALKRTPLCIGASAGIHESQSRLFENLVGRSLRWWRWAYRHDQRLFPEEFGSIGVEDFCCVINRVQPSLIRIEADEATYSLHIVLRFELERELLAGTLAVADLPTAWSERMHAYLGVEVPDDARGVLQDPHWRGRLRGLHHPIALRSAISLELWERAAADLPGLETHLEHGDVEPLNGWLREHLWHLGLQVHRPRDTGARGRQRTRPGALPALPAREGRRARLLDWLHADGPCTRIEARGTSPEAPALARDQRLDDDRRAAADVPAGEAAQLMSTSSRPRAHCGGAFHEPLTMAAKRHRRDPRAVIEAFRALEAGGPTPEQVEAAASRVPPR